MSVAVVAGLEHQSGLVPAAFIALALLVDGPLVAPHGLARPGRRFQCGEGVQLALGGIDLAEPQVGSHPLHPGSGMLGFELNHPIEGQQCLAGVAGAQCRHAKPIVEFRRSGVALIELSELPVGGLGGIGLKLLARFVQYRLVGLCRWSAKACSEYSQR